MDSRFRTDDEVIEAFLRGDSEAIALIDDWVAPIVRNPNWDSSLDTDDRLQEVRLRLTKAFRSTKFMGKSSLQTYVLRIAKRACIDIYRKRTRRPPTVPWEQAGQAIDERADPSQSAEKNSEIEIQKRVFGLLSLECQEILIMIYLEELSIDRIAERLGIARGTVKSKSFRCREKARRIREDLERMEPDGHNERL